MTHTIDLGHLNRGQVFCDGKEFSLIVDGLVLKSKNYQIGHCLIKNSHSLETIDNDFTGTFVIPTAFSRVLTMDVHLIEFETSQDNIQVFTPKILDSCSVLDLFREIDKKIKGR